MKLQLPLNNGRCAVFLTAEEVSQRWHCHRSTVLRICTRFGYRGIKFGGRAAARRYEEQQLARIEVAAGFSPRTK